ncbi:TadE family protein [Aliivibrio sp. S4MY3]|uniref:TadE family protein n=1 Tax=unclassified Aliivibrio TaxID=2645654 RepID=UPI003FCC9250
MIRRNKNKGIASIEFTLGFMGFWLICMGWVEMSYMSYVSAISDLVVSESARVAKTSESDYMDAFHNAVDKNESIWGDVIDPNKFTLSIEYLDKVADLEGTKDPCVVPDDETTAECGVAKDSAIAIYHLDYRFSSIFNYFVDTDSLFSREVIVIQEYERDAFGI